MPINTASDHELLVRIDERVAALQTDFAELKHDVKAKAEATTVTKLAVRVGKIERRMSYICGGLLVLEALLRYVKLPGLAAGH